MSEDPKISRCGFVVVKFNIDGEDHFLMRRNAKWKDINFIGGHALLNEGLDLKRSARRELLEEVPVMRTFKSFELLPLTGQVAHGPVLSRSAAGVVNYILQFYLLKFLKNPRPFLEKLTSRTPNILVSETDLLFPHFHRVSGLVAVLARSVEGGFAAIPHSWREDLGPTIRDLSSVSNNQLSLRMS
jgi:hypothetical protein